MYIYGNQGATHHTITFSAPKITTDSLQITLPVANIGGFVDKEILLAEDSYSFKYRLPTGVSKSYTINYDLKSPATDLLLNAFCDGCVLLPTYTERIIFSKQLEGYTYSKSINDYHIYSKTAEAIPEETISDIIDRYDTALMTNNINKASYKEIPKYNSIETTYPINLHGPFNAYIPAKDSLEIKITYRLSESANIQEANYPQTPNIELYNSTEQ